MAKARRKSTYPDTVKAGIPRLDALPNGWVRSTLEPYLVETKRSVKMDDNKPYDLVTVKRARGGVTKRETRLGRDISVKTQFEIQEDDFLISKRQIVHGACGVVPKHLHGSTVSNEYSVLCANDKIDMQFLKYLSHSQHFQRTCFHSSIGVHIEKMIFKLDQWFKWEFDMPPLSEQRRIAEILGTWDRAIAVTEALIAKSEAQKKALMQQLLTGKRRLPGFEDEWKEVRLGDVAEMTSGNAFKSSDISEEGDYRLIRMNDLKVGVLKNSDPRFVADHALDGLERFILHPGDFVFGMTGSLSNYAWIPPDLANTLYLNQRVGRLSAKNKNSSRFLQQLYLSTSVQNNILRMAAGAAQLNISLRDLRSFIISVPSFDEQKAIARIIDISADEVNVLQTKLQTLKTEKAALMQQLLTGKRRVKLTEAVA